MFVSNVLYGQKLVSPFEIAREYTPSITDFPQTPLDHKFVDADEQIAKRAINKLLRSRNNNVPISKMFKKGEVLYYFERQKKFGKWLLAYVHGIDAVSYTHLTLPTTSRV